ncbi:hypothetical protein BBJ28_00006032 [Nothophytophthora sp. Chile5]|nr:hypothetical protein BBJ28_00006032 [Nothophytophthora sp. Chile5]
MLENESGSPAGGNSVRDQWIANLKKKRVAAAAGNGDAIGTGNPASTLSSGSSNSSVTGNSRNQSGNRSSSTKRNSRSRNGSGSRGSKANNSRGGPAQHSVAALEKSLNAHHRNAHRHSQFATVPSSSVMVDGQMLMTDADALALENPSMLFNELGCFELESPSFTRLMSSSLFEDFPLASPVATASVSARKAKSRSKKAAKPIMKKRPTHCLALDVNQPKPRTPRRKLNCGSATFDDIDLDYDNGSTASSSFSSVGTPSNFRVGALNSSTRHLWGHDLGFPSPGSYADTFLDLPTPRLAEMPLMSSSHQSSSSPHPFSTSTRHSTQTLKEEARLDQPRLIRTSSIEQEGLSYFLEQTNLDGSDGGHGDELYQLATTPHVSPRNPSGSDRPYTSDTSATPRSYGSSSYPQTSEAAAAAVNECFGDKMPPFPTSWAMPSPVGASARAGAVAARRRMTPRNQKQLPEFETLLDEYKFTDIDQELDSFYLNTMETIGSDLDLISN